MDREVPRTSSLFLVLLLSFYALAISPGKLGLQLNKNLADNGKYVYNSIAQFEEDILATWSNEQIAGIAQQGYDDLVITHGVDSAKLGGFRRPTVVTAIVTGHSVYISSSMIGGGSLLYTPNIVNGRANYNPGNLTASNQVGVLKRALAACQLQSTNNSGHRNGANCGEAMAALSFVLTTENGQLDGTKVVTWGRFRDQETNQLDIGVMDPCMTSHGLNYTDTWGCVQLTGPSGLNQIVIGAGTQAVNVTPIHDPTISYACLT